jgi:hypothetical protein
MVLPGPAVQGEGEIWRIAERGQDMPGRSNQKHDRQPAEGTKPSPGFLDEKLVRN